MKAMTNFMYIMRKVKILIKLDDPILIPQIHADLDGYGFNTLEDWEEYLGIKEET